ncbi:MAG: diaminopimelate epimerase, partial [Candidatus Omnitrophota bacterium]
GGDGLLLLDNSKKADFRMRIFNSDGSEAQMCGNGSRCAALFAAVKRIAPPDMSIDTLAGMLAASVKGEMVKVKLTDPKEMRRGFSINIGKCAYKLDYVNTGVPHAVHFVNNVEKVDVSHLGSCIRNHPEFLPAGTNADFVTVEGPSSIKVRTFERGVEGETLACGTGSVASALMAAGTKNMSSPVTVHTRGGERIKVYFDRSGNRFSNVYLEGKAKLVFDGVIEL